MSAAEEKPKVRWGALALFVGALALALLGAALDFATPRASPAMADRAGAASVIGLAGALIAALGAWLMRLALARKERRGGPS
ncbi:MAG: hypothetical protein AB7L65_03430 [Hyphomonadaceae bacterium]